MSGRRRTEGEIADGIAASLSRAAAAKEIALDPATREAERLRLMHLICGILVAGIPGCARAATGE